MDEKFNVIDFYILQGAIQLNDWSDNRKEAIRGIVNKLRPEWMSEIKPGEYWVNSENMGKDFDSTQGVT